MTPSITAPPLADSIIGSVGGNFMMAEWQDEGGPPGPPRPIAPLHVHHRDDEAWYVLEGTLCVQVGDTVVEASSGSCVYVPQGTPHTFWNAGTEPVRYLLIMTPRIFNLIEEIHTIPKVTPATLNQVFAKYDSELLTAPGG